MAELLSPFGSLKACDYQLLPTVPPRAHPLHHSNKMQHTAFPTIRYPQDSVPKAAPPHICQATPRILEGPLFLGNYPIRPWHPTSKSTNKKEGTLTVASFPGN